MKLVPILCLGMLAACVVLALSFARNGWFPGVAFFGTAPFLIALGLMALCVVACLVMRRVARSRGTASCCCRPHSNS